ncbi:hypothetical protein [Streptomyces boncukensis]|uniref:Uncharacterized protein n=1 Tax=Streptomyces boncukensis TaxID=2711219 RepID=A0A6G4WXI5_9ACTN|nr:hypothetical protein [Streptomyces boncukensis]NGO69161.1 hypothetical protein [Streptomyces boncukensis]
MCSRPSLRYRQALLLATLRAEGGAWTTGRVWDLYRTLQLASRRATARHDLGYLARAGLLDRHDGTARHYTLPGGHA